MVLEDSTQRTPSTFEIYPSARCLTVNHLHKVNAVDVGVANEVDEKGPERVLQRVNLQVFQPPTWAVFRCILDAKRHVSGLDLHRKGAKPRIFHRLL